MLGCVVFNTQTLNTEILRRTSPLLTFSRWKASSRLYPNFKHHTSPSAQRFSTSVCVGNIYINDPETLQKILNKTMFIQTVLVTEYKETV